MFDDCPILGNNTSPVSPGGFDLKETQIFGIIIPKYKLESSLILATLPSRV